MCISDEVWKKCSACRRPITYGAVYWACSVSTCNSKRMGLFFCSIGCWDAHLPEARHRSAAAVEQRAPSAPEPEAPAPQSSAKAAAARPALHGDAPREILIVAAHLESYVADRAGEPLKVPPAVLHLLSDYLRERCDAAIQRAQAAGRKTVLERDVAPPPAAPAGPMLCIVSRVKHYIRATADCNTAAAALDLLSAHVRALAHEGVRKVLREERGTLLPSDLPPRAY